MTTANISLKQELFKRKFMDKVIFDYTKKGLSANLGITPERRREIERATAISMWELKHPERDGYTQTDALEAFSKHAQNIQELVFQAFMAGAYFQTEVSEYEEEDISEDE